MFTKLAEMIDEIKKTKSEITKEELKNQIMMKIGSDLRTLKSCSRLLTELKLVEEIDGRIIFK